jgi:hypothetical protein
MRHAAQPNLKDVRQRMSKSGETIVACRVFKTNARRDRPGREFG